MKIEYVSNTGDISTLDVALVQMPVSVGQMRDVVRLVTRRSMIVAAASEMVLRTGMLFDVADTEVLRQEQAYESSVLGVVINTFTALAGQKGSLDLILCTLGDRSISVPQGTTLGYLICGKIELNDQIPAPGAASTGGISTNDIGNKKADINDDDTEDKDGNVNAGSDKTAVEEDDGKDDKTNEKTLPAGLTKTEFSKKTRDEMILCLLTEATGFADVNFEELTKPQIIAVAFPA